MKLTNLTRTLALTLLTASASTLCTPPISAATKTLDAIFGDATELPAYEVFMSILNYNYGNDSWPEMINFVTWKRVPNSDTKLILSGFCGNTSQEFEFEVVNSKNLNATLSATGEYIRYDTYNNPSRGIGMLSGYPYLRGNMWSGYVCDYNWTASSERYVIYSIVKADDGTYAFSSRNAVARCTNNSTSPDSNYKFQNPYYVFAPTNCEISYSKQSPRVNTYYGSITGWYNAVKETTQGYFEIDEANGTFKMMNIGNIGGSMELKNDINYIGYYHGTVDPVTKTFTFDIDEEIPVFVQAFVDNRNNMTDLQYNLRRINTSELYTYTDLRSGTYSLGKPAHNNASNGWVTNGGFRKTFQGGYMKFDYPLTFQYTDDIIEGQINIFNAYSDMTFGSQQDVTLDADLEITEYKVAEANDAMYIAGYVNLNKNTALLAEDGGIDIMIVDGAINDISNITTHDELGIEGAAPFIPTLSKDAAKAVIYKGISENGVVSIPFNKYVTKDEDPNISINRQLSLFIRGRYHENHDLTHTFHSLQTPEMEITTGINVPEIDMNDMRVEFYDLQGRSYGSEQPAAPGVYIRRAGTESKKIVVSAR